MDRNGCPVTENQRECRVLGAKTGESIKGGLLKSQEDKRKTLDLARSKVFGDLISTVSMKYG